MNWNMDDVPMFASVVETGGFSAAADRLGISKSTISKAVTRLEQGLGMRLLERNSRNVRLTSEGEIFYREATLLLEQASNTNELMAGMAAEPSGKLVVALPMAFCREFVARHLPTFRQRYPSVDLDIVITSQPIDIIRERIDLAVVVGTLEDSELTARKLYQSHLVWVSSPNYLNTIQMPRTLEEIRSHIQICEKRYALQQFKVRIGEQHLTMDLKRGIYQVNDPLSVREALIHGGGISLLPIQYARQAINNGQLQQILENVEIESRVASLTAIYPTRRLLAKKTRLFLDFLIEICADFEQ
ncbi:MAG: LysR family transcriptional regulator [Oceanobacter sp.]